ncbi:MAG: NUDIX domain-containing protein [Bacteroidales bacterium]|nr:NUDIX domain-containing protein [Bacteroidales bacterium]
MNMQDLLKKLLPGLLPLIIFIIADEFFDTATSLFIAIGIGVIQAAWIFLREKRIDSFVLLDTGLIVLLGSISLIFENEIFFKIKPGIVEVIMCIMLFSMAWAPTKLLTAMLGRYGMQVSIDEYTIKKFRRSLKILGIIFFFHTLLVFYSAFYLSKEAWAFISGVLFYLIFAAYLGFEVIKNLIIRSRTEWLPIVDKEGNILGKVSRQEAHRNKNFLHPVVHVHVLNRHGELFLQKRSISKQIMPGKWDTAIGGHISWGENLEQAVFRESKEELGIKLKQVKFLGKYVWESDIERELIYVFKTQWDENININKKEIEEGKFWSKAQIKQNIGKGLFTPNFEFEYNLMGKSLKI